MELFLNHYQVVRGERGRSASVGLVVLFLFAWGIPSEEEEGEVPND